MCTHSRLVMTQNENISSLKLAALQLPNKTMNSWLRASECFPALDLPKAMYKTCAVVGGAQAFTHTPEWLDRWWYRDWTRMKQWQVRRSLHFDAVFRVGLQARPQHLRSRERVNVQWLSEVVHHKADTNFYVMGSIHENAHRACLSRSFLTHYSFKNQDDNFVGFMHPRRAQSMTENRTIYNPSLGFFAIKLALHLCADIKLFDYDIHVLDPNAKYRRGWPRISKHHHAFLIERRVIASLLPRCGHPNYDKYL